MPSSPRVLNKRHCGRVENSFYVGRNSKYGNRFVIGVHGDRETCVKAYEADLRDRIEKDPGLLDEIISDLGGKDLTCWCAPLLCHANFLLYLANGGAL